MSELLVATRKGLFTLVRRDARWTIDRADFIGSPVSLVSSDPRDGTRLAALDHGHFGCKLHRSRDGRTWDEIAAPTYPEKPADFVEPEGAQPVPWNLKLIWALQPGGADQPGRVWCGTIPGGLFRSDDGGDSWELVEALWNHPSRAKWFGGGADQPGVHSICVDPRDSRRVLLGVSCGGAWLTTDDGASWEQRAHGMRAAYLPEERALDPENQDPHCIVQCAARPDHCWAQHHNGIFRSTDDARSWHELSENARPSAFGFPVAVHPGDADLAWFVPAVKDEMRIPAEAKVVVSRTRDGGKTFDVLGDGLPQSHAYDLVYRHALDVDPSGDVLAFGSTTGSLWVSEDQGDHWTHVSAHLPPVYAVRFTRA
ncbi:MAG: exo-alpha-sialidase [Planctomycetes bacterium]|nr:exo-alpha-sialidase [Planctomycetota bacterium]